MAGTRGGVGRIAAMVVGLALLLVLLAAGEARAGKYEVISCGWYVGADAGWADTTGGAKFAPDAWCTPPAGADPFDGVHLKSFTRAAGTVSGTRFARWRWQAPAGTGITRFTGTWWHALHDGLEQRIGTEPYGGGFNVFAAASATNATPTNLVAGFSPPQAALEDRLLCAKLESSSCSLEQQSWSALRAVTLTLEDDSPPAAGEGGPIFEGKWQVGWRPIVYWTGELGGGVRYQDAIIDGNRVHLSEYPCSLGTVGGATVGLVMQPCPLGASDTVYINTSLFSDGPHTVRSCSYDVAGNVGCSTELTIAIDNNPPPHPRPVTIAGGEGWHRVDDFDLNWADPPQAPGSPVVGVRYRLTGTNGYDSGVQGVDGLGVASLSDLKVPAAGAWNLHLWLRDEAGNESADTGIDLPLRFDDQPPTLAFANDDGNRAQVAATVTDPLAGPASGTIAVRHADSQSWTELPTKLRTDGPGTATLIAPIDGLAAGTYVFRAEASDAAGNTAGTTLRADGTQMSIQVTAAQAAKGDGAKADGQGVEGAPGRRAKARLFARLRGGHGKGDALTVAFGAPALLAGRLTSAGGAGLAGRRIKVVSRPSHGALVPRTVEWLKSGKRGEFELRLGPGPSRRIAVSFPGSDDLAPAHRRSLDLRVRSGVTLEAAPAALQTGQAVRLSGRVRSRAAPIPRRGKLVAIQYLESDTGRWRPVLVTRTDHVGRFHARYRFRYIDGTARIRLRATALAEERWPYAPGSSAPVTVEVRGG